MVDVLPGQLGDVDQTVPPADVDEGTEVDDPGDDTLADLPLLQLVQEVLANLGLGLLEPGTTRQHNVVAVLVELDDLGLDLLADVGLEIADTAHLDEGCGKEATQADVDDQTTLDDLDDGTGDDAVLFLDLLDRAPGALILSTLLGQDEATFLVLLLLDEGLDLVTDVDDLEGVHVMLDRQLLGRDNTLGLVTDVKENLVAVHLDDGARNDVAVVEVLDGGVHSGQEGLRAAKVVNRHGSIGGVGGILLVDVDRVRGGGLSGGGHVVGLRLMSGGLKRAAAPILVIEHDLLPSEIAQTTTQRSA